MHQQGADAGSLKLKGLSMKKSIFKYTAVFLAFIFLGSAYAQPIVMSVSPPSGPVSGYTFVVINGSGFAGSNQVLFGQNGTQTPAQCWFFGSDTTIYCLTPAVSGPASAMVTVTGGPSGPGDLPNGFVYY